VTSFLPLTTGAAVRLTGSAPPGPDRARAGSLLRVVRETDAAAGECWITLLGGCRETGPWTLESRLRLLSRATSEYVGPRWWFAEGSAHRGRVARTQSHVEGAVADRDGQEFAIAFVGYDNAIASAVVCGHQRAGSPTT
jgi:hypothetical protein